MALNVLEISAAFVISSATCASLVSFFFLLKKYYNAATAHLGIRALVL